MRVALRSRTGNIVIGALGVVYAVSAIALLIYYVIDTWGAAGLTDRLLQGALVAAAIAGYFFISIALNNLGQHRAPQPRRAGAATAS